MNLQNDKPWTRVLATTFRALILFVAAIILACPIAQAFSQFFDLRWRNAVFYAVVIAVYPALGFGFMALLAAVTLYCERVHHKLGLRMCEGEGRAIPWETIRRGAKVTVLIHTALLVILTAILVFTVPIIGMVYANFGSRLPSLTMFVFNLSDFCKRCGVLTIPAVAFLLWLDGHMFTLLYLTHGRRRAWAWCWGIAFLLAGAIATVILALYLPKLRIIMLNS